MTGGGPLAALTRLPALDLSGNDIDDVRPLEAMTCLTWLDLSRNPLTSPDALRGASYLALLAVDRTGLDSFLTCPPCPASELCRLRATTWSTWRHCATHGRFAPSTCAPTTSATWPHWPDWSNWSASTYRRTDRRS